MVIGETRLRRARGTVAFLLVTCCVVVAAAVVPDSEFERGNQAYEAGEFDQARQAYESVIAAGIDDPRVEYNLGNVYWRLGQIGRAILHYERARRLAPTDREILGNLALAGERVVDRVVPPPQPSSPVRKWTALQDRIGFDSQLVLVLSLVWVIGGLLAWAGARRGQVSAALGWAVAAAVVCAAFAALSWWSTYCRQRPANQAVILEAAIDVLAGPKADQATLFVAHEGLVVDVRDRRGAWIEIGALNGLGGWIPETAVERIDGSTK